MMNQSFYKGMLLPHEARSCNSSNVHDCITSWVKSWYFRDAHCIAWHIQIIFTYVSPTQSLSAWHPPCTRKILLSHLLSLEKVHFKNAKQTNLATGWWWRRVSCRLKKFVSRRLCFSWAGCPIIQPSSATSPGRSSGRWSPSQESPPCPACPATSPPECNRPLFSRFQSASQMKPLLPPKVAPLAYKFGYQK